MKKRIYLTRDLLGFLSPASELLPGWRKAGRGVQFAASLITGWSQCRQPGSASPPSQALLRGAGGRRRREARGRSEEKGNQRHPSLKREEGSASALPCSARLGCSRPGHCSALPAPQPRRRFSTADRGGWSGGAVSTADSGRDAPLRGQRSAGRGSTSRRAPRCAAADADAAPSRRQRARLSAPRRRECCSALRLRACPPRCPPPRHYQLWWNRVPRQLRMRRGKNF